MKRKSERRNNRLLIGITAASLALLSLVAGYETLRGEKVTRVVDGDTFIIANKQWIRLYGLGAPEMKHCLGEASKQYLSKLILNKKVILKEPITESHGRIMALVYQNGKLVNEDMIRSGMAQYLFYGGTQNEKMKIAYYDAKNHAAGIHSSMCTQLTPPDPKCVIKGNFDSTTKQKVFYTPDCMYYPNVKVLKHQGDDWFCSEQDAINAGFEKGTKCK